jgi:hypothetical protein
MQIESEHKKELANLTKLYTNKAKYNDENDSFSYKLTIFHDMYDRVDISQSAKLKAFSTMLKDLILDYYYSNMLEENKGLMGRLMQPAGAGYEHGNGGK